MADVQKVIQVTFDKAEDDNVKMRFWIATMRLHHLYDNSDDYDKQTGWN